MDHKIHNYFSSHNATFKKYTTVKFALEIQADYLIVETIEYCYRAVWEKKVQRDIHVHSFGNVKIYVLIYNLSTFSDLQMDRMPSYLHANKQFRIQLPKQTNKNKLCQKHTDESL